jgi:uncharacterized membrane protein
MITTWQSAVVSAQVALFSGSNADSMEKLYEALGGGALAKKAATASNTVPAMQNNVTQAFEAAIIPMAWNMDYYPL